jgi:hypothetical protein
VKIDVNAEGKEIAAFRVPVCTVSTLTLASALFVISNSSEWELLASKFLCTLHLICSSLTFFPVLPKISKIQVIDDL